MPLRPVVGSTISRSTYGGGFGALGMREAIYSLSDHTSSWHLLYRPSNCECNTLCVGSRWFCAGSQRCALLGRCDRSSWSVMGCCCIGAGPCLVNMDEVIRIGAETDTALKVRLADHILQGIVFVREPVRQSVPVLTA